MPINNFLLSTSIFIDCLKHFQKHPEQFPLDLRAKFCACNNSNYSNNDLTQLTIVAKEFINMLQQKLKSQSISNDSQIRLHNKSISRKQSSTNTIPSSSNASILYIHHSKTKKYKRYDSPTDRLHSKTMKRKKKFKQKKSRSSFSIHRLKKSFSRETHVSDSTSPKTNEQQILLQSVIQPGLIKEKLVNNQPIPFVMFRLCCPPGMIPLTVKVAERLGININTTNQIN